MSEMVIFGYICTWSHGTLRIPKIQFTDHMKLMKEDQNVDALVLLRRGTRYS